MPSHCLPSQHTLPFHLDVQQLPNEMLTVLRFHCEAFGLSREYVFKIAVLSSQTLENPKMLRSRQATLSLAWGQEWINYIGVIHAISDAVEMEEIVYTLTLVSPLYSLKLRCTPHIWEQANVKTVLHHYLMQANQSYPFRIDWQLKRELSTRDCLHHFYDENNFEFLIRLLSEYGLHYYWQAQTDLPTLIITDDIQSTGCIPGIDKLVLNRPNRMATHEQASIYEFECDIDNIPANVMVEGSSLSHSAYQVRTPIKSHLQSHKKTCRFIPAQAFHDIKTGNCFANIRAESIACEAITWEGKTDCIGLWPGYTIDIQGHHEKTWNQRYRLINMSLEGDQSSLILTQAKAIHTPQITYQNHTTFIMESEPHRPSLKQRSPFHGLLTGIIIGDDNGTPQLDNQGRYRAYLPFLNLKPEEFPKGEPSPWMPLLMPYGGKSNERIIGQHFPIRADTEVAILALDGDLDQLIILGALSNLESPSPIKASNNHQHILKTWANNTFKTSELPQHQNTPTQSTLLYHTHAPEHHLQLSHQRCQSGALTNSLLQLGSIGDTNLTNHGPLKQLVGNNLTLKTGNSHALQVKSNHHLHVQQSITYYSKDKLSLTIDGKLIEDAHGSFCFSAEKNISMSAKRTLTIAGQDKTIKLLAKKNINLESKKHLHLNSEKSLELSSSKKANNISLSLDGIQLWKSHHLHLRAKQIEFHGELEE